MIFKFFNSYLFIYFESYGKKLKPKGRKVENNQNKVADKEPTVQCATLEQKEPKPYQMSDEERKEYIK